MCIRDSPEVGHQRNGGAFGLHHVVGVQHQAQVVAHRRLGPIGLVGNVLRLGIDRVDAGSVAHVHDVVLFRFGEKAAWTAMGAQRRYTA